MKRLFLILVYILYATYIDCAKINTPRVLLPWFKDATVNFKFEIIGGGCYTWSLSRDDIIDLEPIYDDAWAHCSRSARVSVSKTCVPPGSVIIFAEEVSSGEVIRGDVDIDKIETLKVISTTWKLYLEEAPEAFDVDAYDNQGNKFSTLEGLSFLWTIKNHEDFGDEPLVTFVEWRNTDYKAPPGVTELESIGLKSHSVLLYGQAMGACQVTVCLNKICTDFNLQVVASVVLTPATALIAPGDSLRYRVVRVKAGRLSNQDISETLYYLTVPNAGVAFLEDNISLVRSQKLGTTRIQLMSGVSEMASSTLTVVEPDSILVTLRPSSLIIRGEAFRIHCVVYADGHPLWTGEDSLIKLATAGDADIHLLKSTRNGTVTDAVAKNSGHVVVTARLHSVAGKALLKKIEGQVTAVAVDPLQIIPPILYVAWTDSKQEINLKYRGGGDEAVTWYQSERSVHDLNNAISLTPEGETTILGVADSLVNVRLTKYPHVKAEGRIRSAPPELVQVSSTGRARVDRPHYLHLALTATDPATGDLYNFNKCDCGSFAVSLLEGPEPQNVTAATWVQPEEGACCVLECWFKIRGVATIRVSRGRIGDTHRIVVNAAPKILWPGNVAALPFATLPLIVEGEALYPYSNEPRVVDLVNRDGTSPHNYPDARLFTIKCHKKGDGHLTLTSQTEQDSTSVSIETSCAPHASKIRLEPISSRNCSNRPVVWLRANQEVSLKVSLLDAIGRELFDERGPNVLFETEPNHIGIDFKSTDGLFVETHPDFYPVPVPLKFYQIISASEQATGWSGTIKASFPDAVANIEAKVVAPLKVEAMKVNIAWEGEAVANITKISGGSGRYFVETPKGVSAKIEDAILSAIVPGPGSYDLLVTDQCVHGESQHVEMHIEEILTVEVSTSRAICVNACVPITALVKGISYIYLTTSHSPMWSVQGDVIIKDDLLCGLREGSGRVKASLGNIWSPEVEIAVFPPLQIIPSRGVVPPGSKVQLHHIGGPLPHLASLAYRSSSHKIMQVSQNGLVLGISKGSGRVRLTATDILGNEMASAEAEIEVIPLSGIRIRAATQTLLIGKPSPLYVEAGGLSPASLYGLQPTPKATWTVRDPTMARLYNTHTDDFLERAVVEGLAVRVVPLKAGVITIDVRVRNLAQSETRTWDSTIEILSVSNIRLSVAGLPSDFDTVDKLSLAVGAIVRIKSFPKSEFKSFDDGSFKVNSDGEVRALKPGSGVIMACHSDDLNNVYREATIHVEVSTPHYCTAESTTSEDDAVSIVLRNSLGQALIAPHTDVSVAAPLKSVTRLDNGGLTSTLLIQGVAETGTFAKFQTTVAGITLKDEVFLAGFDTKSSRIFALGGWLVCVTGIGWSAPPAVTLFQGSDVTLALLNSVTPSAHVLKQGQQTRIITQVALNKFEFASTDSPYSAVPLTIEAPGLTNGPIVCTEDQKYAVDGLEVRLPFVCRTKIPHTAEPYIDVINGEIGCSIIPAAPIVEASDIELCAEWDIYRTCTKVTLLPQITVSSSKISLLNPPTVFTINGHPKALKMVKISPSPGLKLETNTKQGDIIVTVKSETSVCGIGWVTVKSKLTAQEIRLEVERECEVACGTLLGALLSLLKPYLSTLMTIVAVAAAYLYVQSRMKNQGMYRAPLDTSQSFIQRETSLWRLD